MADRRIEAFDAFEVRLARDLRELSAPAVAAVDARALVAALAAGEPRRPSALALPRSDARVVLVIAAAVALLATLLVVALARPPAPTLAQPRLGHLAFGLGGEIWVADWDGSSARRVTDAVSRGREATDPRWHGTTLTFLEDPQSGATQWLGILRAPNEGPSYVELPTAAGVAVHVAVSPDARRYVLLNRPELRIGDLTDGRVLGVPPPHGYEAWDDSDLASLAWDPSGTFFLAGACQRAAACWRDDGEPAAHDLFRVSVDGTVSPRLSSGERPAYAAVVSPTGDRIAFASCHVPDGSVAPLGCDPRGYDVGVMGLDGRGRRIVDETTASQGFGSGVHPVFSPDGSRIAYAYQKGDQDAGLYVADLDTGSAPVLLGRNGWPVAWSPDGTRILSPWPRLEAVAADGSGSTPLADPSVADKIPLADWAWIPAGQVDPFDAPGR
jgi:hypothetical protein